MIGLQCERRRCGWRLGQMALRVVQRVAESKALLEPRHAPDPMQLVANVLALTLIQITLAKDLKQVSDLLRDSLLRRGALMRRKSFDHTPELSELLVELLKNKTVHETLLLIFGWVVVSI